MFWLGFAIGIVGGYRIGQRLRSTVAVPAHPFDYRDPATWMPVTNSWSGPMTTFTISPKH